MSSNGLNSTEKRAAIGLASVFGLRMLGLFMILPVFTIYGTHISGYTPFLAGLAIGAYGLTQAILQIPMGMLSDKFGRKPIIVSGLILFAIGSFIAATAESMTWIIIGRAVQGMGAIASAIMALAADITREEQRAKVMAVIGAFIGLSFAIALGLGPVLAEAFELDGIFLFTAGMALVGIAVILFVVPSSQIKASAQNQTPAKKQLGQMLKNGNLSRLNVGVFVLHLCMTAMFVALPQMLVEAGLTQQNHWKLYLPALLVSLLLMAPMMMATRKKDKEASMFKLAIIFMLISVVCLELGASELWLLITATVIFFVGFNYLEANMPSILSRIAPADAKGSAMGIYSSSQFMGAFLGGALAGLVQQMFGLQHIFLVCAVILVVWFVVAFGMKFPAKTKQLTIGLTEKMVADTDAFLAQLSGLTGVVEATVIADQKVGYLKINDKFDQHQLDQIIAQN